MAALKPLLGAVAALGLLVGGVALVASPDAGVAYAQSAGAKATVDAAITRGEVGEQIDGYLAVVDGASPSAAVRNAVSEINIARKAVYTDLANAQNVQTSVVAALTGEKQLKKALPGTYIKDATGQWRKK